MCFFLSFLATVNIIVQALSSPLILSSPNRNLYLTDQLSWFSLPNHNQSIFQAESNIIILKHRCDHVTPCLRTFKAPYYLQDNPKALAEPKRLTILPTLPFRPYLLLIFLFPPLSKHLPPTIEHRHLYSCFPQFLPFPSICQAIENASSAMKLPNMYKQLVFFWSFRAFACMSTSRIIICSDLVVSNSCLPSLVILGRGNMCLCVTIPSTEQAL